jgi:hypothetical protein
MTTDDIRTRLIAAIKDLPDTASWHDVMSVVKHEYPLMARITPEGATAKQRTLHETIHEMVSAWPAFREDLIDSFGRLSCGNGSDFEVVWTLQECDIFCVFCRCLCESNLTKEESISICAYLEKLFNGNIDDWIQAAGCVENLFHHTSDDGASLVPYFGPKTMEHYRVARKT